MRSCWLLDGSARFPGLPRLRLIVRSQMPSAIATSTFSSVRQQPPLPLRRGPIHPYDRPSRMVSSATDPRFCIARQTSAPFQPAPPFDRHRVTTRPPFIGNWPNAMLFHCVRWNWEIPIASRESLITIVYRILYHTRGWLLEGLWKPDNKFSNSPRI